MISYEQFWNTLKLKKVSTYTLINKHNISNGTLSRMRKREFISTATIDKFCKILNCKVEDIITYIPDEYENCIKDYLATYQINRKDVDIMLDSLIVELNDDEKRLLVYLINAIKSYTNDQSKVSK